MTSASEPSQTTPPPNHRGGLRTALRTGVVLLIVGFVASRVMKLIDADDLRGLQLQPGWLILAFLAYVAAWMPSVLMWGRMLSVTGNPVSLPVQTTGYFIGHLGKYVPGKALVPILRADAVRQAGGSFRMGVLTAVYETLFFMGMGLLVTFALTGYSIPGSMLPTILQPITGQPFIPPLLSIVALGLVLPILSPLLSMVARKMAPRDESSDGPESQSGAAPATHEINIPVWLLIRSAIEMTGGWILLGASLMFTLRALDPVLLSGSLLLTCTGCCALATSVGFLMILSPGGLGVREGLLIETLRLHPEISNGSAVMASIVLRGLWLIAELAAAGILWGLMKKFAHRK